MMISTFLTNSLIFEVYFRVSKHLGCFVSDVIRKKFNPDYSLLITRYYREVLSEVKAQEELEEKMK